MISRMKIPRMKIKKPSKRTFFIFSIVMTLVAAFVISASIVYAKSMDDMIPTDKTTNTLYNKYSPSHYAFQTAMPDRHFWQIGAKAADGINSMYDTGLSMLFLAGVQITRFFNFIAREAFTFGYMDSLIKGAEQIIQSISGIDNGTIGSGLWSSMFGLFSSIAVLFILWQFVRLKFLDSLQTMISFVLALVIAFAFFTQAGTFLRFLIQPGMN